VERLPFLPGTIVRIKDIESLDEGSEKDADVTGCDPAKKRRRLRQEEEVDVVCVTSIDKISGKEILTDTQKAALKTSFEKDDHPDVEGVLTLSKKLHLTQEQVDVSSLCILYFRFFRLQLSGWFHQETTNLIKHLTWS
jgi:hypothetical protein